MADIINMADFAKEAPKDIRSQPYKPQEHSARDQTSWEKKGEWARGSFRSGPQRISREDKIILSKNLNKILRRYGIEKPRCFSRHRHNMGYNNKVFGTVFSQLKGKNTERIPPSKSIWELFLPVLHKTITDTRSSITQSNLWYQLLKGSSYLPVNLDSENNAEQLIEILEQFGEKLNEKYNLLDKFKNINEAFRSIFLEDIASGRDGVIDSYDDSLNIYVDDRDSHISNPYTGKDIWCGCNLDLFREYPSDYFSSEYLAGKNMGQLGHHQIIMDCSEDDLQEFFDIYREAAQNSSTKDESEHYIYCAAHFLKCREFVYDNKLLFSKSPDFDENSAPSAFIGFDYAAYSDTEIEKLPEIKRHLQSYNSSIKELLSDWELGKIYLYYFPDKDMTGIFPYIYILDEEGTRTERLTVEYISSSTRTFRNADWLNDDKDLACNFEDLIFQQFPSIKRQLESSCSLENHPVLEEKRRREEKRRQAITDFLED